MAKSLHESLTMYLVDHLFVLVGNNPLPCYVAGTLLVKQGGTTHLIYTSQTQEYANTLVTMLPRTTLHSLNTGAREAKRVYDEVKRWSSAVAKQTIGLHYTGGTKVMAIHAYRAIIEVAPNAICSYLDPDELALHFERDGVALGSPIRLTPVESNHLVGLTLHQLWQLHGKEPLRVEDNPGAFSERVEPLLPGVAELLAVHFSRGEGQSWIDSFNDDKKRQIQKLADTVPITSLPFDDVVGQLAKIEPAICTIGDLKRRLGQRACNYLGNGGDWLEDIVLQSLNELKSELALQDVVCSAATKKAKSREREMELDVVAIRGYQLFVFSCYVGKNMDTCKSKLYEAAMRAYQLGGSEARFALICGHNNKAHVKSQMSGTLLSRSFEVFDIHDFTTLKEELRRWILEVDKETSL